MGEGFFDDLCHSGVPKFLEPAGGNFGVLAGFCFGKGAGEVECCRFDSPRSIEGFAGDEGRGKADCESGGDLGGC